MNETSPLLPHMEWENTVININGVEAARILTAHEPILTVQFKQSDIDWWKKGFSKNEALAIRFGVPPIKAIANAKKDRLSYRYKKQNRFMRRDKVARFKADRAEWVAAVAEAEKKKGSALTGFEELNLSFSRGLTYKSE